MLLVGGSLYDALLAATSGHSCRIGMRPRRQIPFNIAPLGARSLYSFGGALIGHRIQNSELINGLCPDDASIVEGVVLSKY